MLSELLLDGDSEKFGEPLAAAEGETRDESERAGVKLAVAAHDSVSKTLEEAPREGSIDADAGAEADRSTDLEDASVFVAEAVASRDALIRVVTDAVVVLEGESDEVAVRLLLSEPHVVALGHALARRERVGDGDAD